MGIPWGLIAYGVIALAAAAFYATWHHKVYSEGEADGIAAQFKADKPILDACDKHGNKEPARCAAFIEEILAMKDAREAEAAACATSAGKQNAAIEAIAKATASAVAAAQAMQLAAIAGAKENTARECKDELARVNGVLDSYKRRGVQ
jgi:hypothetical protein